MENPKEKVKDYYKKFKGEEKDPDKSRKIPVSLITSLTLTIILFILGRRNLIEFNFLPQVPLPEYINLLIETYPYAILGVTLAAIVVFSITIKSFKAFKDSSEKSYWEKAIGFIHYTIIIPTVILIIIYIAFLTFLLGFTAPINNFISVLTLLVSFLLYEYFTSSFLISIEFKKRFSAGSYEELKEKAKKRSISPFTLFKFFLLGVYAVLLFYLIVINSGMEAIIMVPTAWIFLVTLMNLSHAFKILSENISVVKVKLSERATGKSTVKEEPKEGLFLDEEKGFVKIMLEDSFPNWCLINEVDIELMEFEKE